MRCGVPPVPEMRLGTRSPEQSADAALLQPAQILALQTRRLSLVSPRKRTSRVCEIMIFDACPVG